MFSFFTPPHGAWWRLLPFQAMVTHPGTHSCLLLIAGGGNLETLGLLMGLPVAQVVKNLPASRGDAGSFFFFFFEMQVLSLGQEDSPEKEITIHFNILAWEIP